MTDTDRLNWIDAKARLPEGQRCLLCTTPTGFVVVYDRVLFEGSEIPEVVGDAAPDIRTAIDNAMARNP